MEWIRFSLIKATMISFHREGFKIGFKRCSLAVMINKYQNKNMQFLPRLMHDTYNVHRTTKKHINYLAL